MSLTGISGTVQTPTMVSIGIAGALAAILPFVLLVYFKKKKGADVLPFFIGFAVFALFALVLEGAINYAISQTEFFKVIQQNVWLYAAYGGLMAGIFEETGRLIAFKTVLKKRLNNDSNALMYGAGHGGIEAIAVFGATCVTNIVLSLMINSGSIASVTANVPAEAAQQVRQLLDQLITYSPWVYLLGFYERVLAIALHIALSVLVWFGVKNRKPGLYFLSILLHAGLDGLIVILTMQFKLNEIIVEGILTVLTLFICVIAFAVWKKSRTSEREA